jgi:hypothetical protein
MCAWASAPYRAHALGSATLQAEQLGIVTWTEAIFPVLILFGSVLWDNLSRKVATIHVGDWLVKLLVIATLLVSGALKRASFDESAILRRITMTYTADSRVDAYIDGLPEWQ